MQQTSKAKSRRRKASAGLPGFGKDTTRNLWYARITLANGKRKRLTEPGDLPESVAEQALKKRIQAYVNAPNAMHGAEPLQTYLTAYTQRKDLAPKTREVYQGLIEKHLTDLGGKPLLDVTPDDIDRALEKIGPQKARTRQAVRFLLRGVFQEAIFRKIVAVGCNPVDGTRQVKYEKAEKPRAFRREHLPYLLRATRDPRFIRLGAMVPLMLFTSIGPAESHGAQRHDLDFAAGTLRIERDCVETRDGEGDEAKYRPVVGPVKARKRRRTVYLPPVVVTALREHLQRNGMLIAEGDGTEHIFTAPQGGLIRHRQLCSRWWKPLLQEAARLAAVDGVAFPTGLGMYALRHTYREIGSAKKVGYDLLSKNMGHSRLSTTFDNYNEDVWEERGREAADLMQSFFEELPPTGTDSK